MSVPIGPPAETPATAPLLTTLEAAGYLRFASTERFVEAVDAGAIPVYRRGARTRLFHRGQLDRWLVEAER